MLDLHRNTNPTKPNARDAHRIDELARAQALIREVIRGDYPYLSGCSMTNLAEVAGIIAVEREQLENDRCLTCPPSPTG